MLKEGDAAPDFTGKDQNGENVKLADYRGQKVVLYFYPKDDTPGCTKEACSFRDNYLSLTQNNIKVIGISTDDEKSHQKFISKYELPFTLIADTDHAIADAYDSYGEKKFMGKTYNGVLRKTFLIGEDGRIVKIFDKVKVDEHSTEVLNGFGE